MDIQSSTPSIDDLISAVGPKQLSTALTPKGRQRQPLFEAYSSDRLIWSAVHDSKSNVIELLPLSQIGRLLKLSCVTTVKGSIAFGRGKEGCEGGTLSSRGGGVLSARFLVVFDGGFACESSAGFLEAFAIASLVIELLWWV